MAIGKLGRYEIVAEIGQGAMGTVYKAVDPVIERTVAIKTVRLDVDDEESREYRSRFSREAKSAGRLAHPNVVTIYDAGESGNLAYIAMEFLEGRSLRQMLDAGGKLPIHTIADIAAQIAEGLAYAHQFSVVHRDIKPANMMVLPSGLVKITDFGIAYVPSAAKTQTGVLLGSPKYMSPEQVQGVAPDGRSDIFSLGVVLYEMLAGRAPFVAEGDTTIFSLMNRIVTEPHVPVTRLDARVPAAFDLILARALAKRREDRYQRALDFANDLRNYKALAPQAADTTQMVRRAAPASAPAARAPAPGLLWQQTGEQRQEGQMRRAGREEGAAQIEAGMKQCFGYLSDMVKQINVVGPQAPSGYELPYAGTLAGMRIGDGFADYRMQQTDGRERYDYITLRYRMAAPQPLTVHTAKEESARLREQLTRHGLEFEFNEVRNDFGIHLRGTFVIKCEVMARARITPDYGHQRLLISARNIGRFGAADYALGAADARVGAFEEFGNLIMGLPNEFARFARRA